MRSMALAVVVLSLGIAYVESYYRLSRRGMQEMEFEVGGSEMFLYVPWNDAARARDLTRHHQLSMLFTPANFVDRNLFGGPHPIRGVTWDLE